MGNMKVQTAAVLMFWHFPLLAAFFSAAYWTFHRKSKEDFRETWTSFASGALYFVAQKASPFVFFFLFTRNAGFNHIRLIPIPWSWWMAPIYFLVGDFWFYIYH